MHWLYLAGLDVMTWWMPLFPSHMFGRHTTLLCVYFLSPLHLQCPCFYSYTTLLCGYFLSPLHLQCPCFYSYARNWSEHINFDQKNYPCASLDMFVQTLIILFCCRNLPEADNGGRWTMQQHYISTVFRCYDCLGVRETIPVRFLDYSWVES
jgi:hypothetical protein